MTMTDLRAIENPVEAIRDYLGHDGRNWCKGQIFTDDGKACLIGASVRAKTYGRENERITEAINEQFPEREMRQIPTGTSMTHSFIGDFNDHPDTVWADVELVLDKASVRWEESR